MQSDWVFMSSLTFILFQDPEASTVFSRADILPFHSKNNTSVTSNINDSSPLLKFPTELYSVTVSQQE